MRAPDLSVVIIVIAAVSRFRDRRDSAKQSMSFVIDASGKEYKLAYLGKKVLVPVGTPR